MNPIPPQPDDACWRQMLQYLDGTLPVDEVAALNTRLQNDAELRSAYADLVVQQIQLGELEQEAAALAEEATAGPLSENIIPLDLQPQFVTSAQNDARPHPLRRGLKRSPALSVLALAAALALLVTVAAMLLQPARVARIAELEGTVVIERGDRKFAATTGATLRDGDRLVTTLNSRVSYDYLQEETRVALDPSTRLALSTVKEAKHLELSGGAITADVAKQQPGAPLTLATPQTQAVVVGTRFKLSTSGTSTRLAVFEGAVTVLADQEEAPSLLVEAGTAVLVEPGSPSRLVKLASERGSILLENLTADGTVTDQSYLSQLMFSGAGATPGGSRIRGYLHPPRSGAFSFHLTASSQAELWLADAAEPSSARLIASSAGVQAENTVVQLQAGQARYLELRLKNPDAATTCTLSWTMPGGLRRVIYGEHLTPFDPSAE